MLLYICMLFRLFLVIFYAHVMVYTLCASICPMYAQNVYLYKRQSKIYIDTIKYINAICVGFDNFFLL